MNGRWRLVQKLSIIALAGIVLTVLFGQIVLHSERQAINERLREDTRQLEYQFRQVLRNYAFATEWTARDLSRSGQQALNLLADEAMALFLYYPSLQRILVLDEYYETNFERAARQAPPLTQAQFSNTPIAAKLKANTDFPHAQSALAGAFSETPEDIVLAISFDGHQGPQYLVLVVDIKRLFDSFIRNEINEGYQVEVSLDGAPVYRFAGSDELRDAWSIQRPLEFSSNQWRMDLWPTSEKLTDMHSASFAVVVSVGSLLTLGGLLLGWRSQQLQQRLNSSQQLIQQATKQLKIMHSAEDRLLFLSNNDALTELPNRNGLQHYLEVKMETARQQTSDFTIFVTCIDAFDELNHALGHPMGDEIIKRLSLRIQKALPAGAFIARVSTDCFVVIAAKSDAQTTYALAESIRHSITPQLFIEQHEIYCSVSIGIAYAEESGYDVETLLYNGDCAVYRAKQQGYFGIEFYQPEHLHQRRSRNQRIQQLREALETDQIGLHYQPIVHLREARTVAVEGLLRWRTPSGESVEPKEFLELMEQTGLIFSLTEFIIKSSFLQLANWQSDYDKNLKLCLNLSLRQLTMPELPELIRHYQKRFQLSAEQIQLEFNEDVYLQLCKSHKLTVEQLKKLGMQICITITGVSNCLLEAIRYCRPHVLKIAPELIAEIPHEAITTELVESIIKIAQNLRLQVIAVAVEEQQQADFLLQRNCVLVQGHYLARPQSAQDLAPLLQQPIKLNQ